MAALVGLVAIIVAVVYIAFPDTWRDQTARFNLRQADQIDVARCIEKNEKAVSSLSVPKETIRQTCVDKLQFPLGSKVTVNGTLSRFYGIQANLTNDTADKVITSLEIWIKTKPSKDEPERFSATIPVRGLFILPKNAGSAALSVPPNVLDIMIDSDQRFRDFDWYIENVSGVHFRVQ